jgi:hypothetical protein
VAALPAQAVETLTAVALLLEFKGLRDFDTEVPAEQFAKHSEEIVVDGCKKSLLASQGPSVER